MQSVIMGNPREFHDICRAYDVFERNGINVRSPKRHDIANMEDYSSLYLGRLKTSSPYQFTKKSLDLLRTLWEDIRVSDFIYFVTSFNALHGVEPLAVGFALALEKPMFSTTRIENHPVGDYVTICSPEGVVEFLRKHPIE